MEGKKGGGHIQYKIKADEIKNEIHSSLKMPISCKETALHLLLLTLLGAVFYILRKKAKTEMISTKAR